MRAREEPERGRVPKGASTVVVEHGQRLPGGPGRRVELEAAHSRPQTSQAHGSYVGDQGASREARDGDAGGSDRPEGAPREHRSTR